MTLIRNYSQQELNALSVQQAREEGNRAGELGHGASMNPNQSGTIEHEVWENARAYNIGYRLNSRVKLAGEIC